MGTDTSISISISINQTACSHHSSHSHIDKVALMLWSSCCGRALCDPIVWPSSRATITHALKTKGKGHGTTPRHKYDYRLGTVEMSRGLDLHLVLRPQHRRSRKHGGCSRSRLGTPRHASDQAVRILHHRTHREHRFRVILHRVARNQSR